MLGLLLPLVLLANGLAAGVLVGTQLGGWPLLRGLPPDRYVQAHAFFATRYDPFMPVCFVVTFAGDLALVFADDGPRRVAFGVAALLTVTAMVISLVKNVPVNKWLRTLDPDNLPADFARLDPRKHWGAWNRVRGTLSVLAFALNCAALGFLLSTRI
ncbi:DUF1772 domain-containing protein [Amycolatopsis alba]|uniref:DUF1772 domain-containing protein n=1 Tax=Amycolatopsis alba DSM 44262 TaxID=1125972 RepID=A0A229S8F2_AMYAL|nr:DUF1772 domain-containing protein [Amycolatopsis alba]OXM55198.1 DUF1772 domain-containing protein [Amycolatopsis alba DSM 44262]